MIIIFVNGLSVVIFFIAEEMILVCVFGSFPDEFCSVDDH
jgi:hypothetical protein